MTRQDHSPTFRPFNEEGELRVYVRNLPHWRQPGVTYFVTFRQADSIPKGVLAEWLKLRDRWYRARGIDPDWQRTSPDRFDAAYASLSADTRRTFEREQAKLLHEELDRCHGSCVLRGDPPRDIIEGSLRFFHGERLWMGDYMVMPNHVHALVTPSDGWELEDLLGSIKKWTSRLIVRWLEGRSDLERPAEPIHQKPRFWQYESYDRIVRDAEELGRFRNYIAVNPAKANLSAGEYSYYPASGLTTLPNAHQPIERSLTLRVESSARLGESSYAGAEMEAELTSLAERLTEVRFARPSALALIALLPVFTIVSWISGRGRRRALLRFGTPGLLGEPEAVRRVSRRFAHACFLLGFAALAVAVAGPTLGTADEENVSVGRDLIIVLDMSRSMRAGDMAESSDGDFSRFAAAKAGLSELANAAQRRGGHRLGLVVFAARPTVLVPLTTDYDHFRAKLARLDAMFPPPAVEPDKQTAASGTRIGAAIELAVGTHDPKFLGYRDILLVTDGDDPADDDEWRRGIGPARRAEIPVHTVLLGESTGRGALIPEIEGGVLSHNGWEVTTTANPDIPKSIAEQTRGAFLSSEQRVPDLGSFFRERIEPMPSRELPEEALPRPRDRSAWFYGPALGLFLLGWWLEDRRRKPRRTW